MRISKVRFSVAMVWMLILWLALPVAFPRHSLLGGMATNLFGPLFVGLEVRMPFVLQSSATVAWVVCAYAWWKFPVTVKRDEG